MYQKNNKIPGVLYNNGVIRLDFDQLTAERLEMKINDRVLHLLDVSNDETVLSELTLTRLVELRDEFLQHLKLGMKRKNRRKRKTGISDKDYENRTGLFVKWLKQNSVEIVTLQHWVDWYATLLDSLQPVTVRNYYRNVNGFAEWLVEHKHLSSNPLANIVPPDAHKTNIHSKAIPVDDIKIMLQYAANNRDRTIFTFFRDTGCRGAEAAALKWKDIELKNMMVHLNGKGCKPRSVPIKESTVAALEKYRAKLLPPQQTGSVWYGKRKGPLTYNGIYQMFKRTADRANLVGSKTNPHSWRHAFGRDMTANGMPTIVLKIMMGHESVETTEQYSEVSQEIIRQSYRKYAPDDDQDILELMNQ